jgi:hypothetical protein
MNRIFRIVWNASSGLTAGVAENAESRTLACFLPAALDTAPQYETPCHIAGSNGLICP